MKRHTRLIAWISVFFLSCFLLPRPGFATAEDSAAAFQDAFVKADGTFDTSADGFPENYRFDFSGRLGGNAYGTQVPLSFFHAAKASGHTVTIVDNIGVEYSYAPADITDIATENFSTTVKVGGRYRTTASYKNVAEGFAKEAGIPIEEYVLHQDYTFLEVWTGETAVNNCTIHVAVDSSGNGAYADGFYEAAAKGELYVYQYSSQVLTDRATELAGTGERPKVVLHKTETGTMAFLLSLKPLRDEPKDPEDPKEEPSDPVDPPSSAPFDPSFVKDGKFVTDAPGFPKDYVFTFSSYTADTGHSKELFQAIKNSGRKVTLTTRTGVNYIIDGAQMTDLTAAEMAELVQIQALYKNSASFQTVMQKIADEGHIYDGFYMNEDWIILDFQPWTGDAATYQATNGFPIEVEVTVRLNNGQTGATGDEIADRFAEYARQGLLKAYTYDKTTSIQDLKEDVAPLNITANDAGEVCFTLKEPVTLVFSRKDLLSGRGGEETNTNPYEMRIKKDGKNIGDGYTIEVGDVQYLDLLMENGNLEDHEYIWEVIGPGKDCVILEEVEGSNNLSYKLEAVQASAADQSFQIMVSVKGETDNFIKTGLITVVDTVYGKGFVKDGKFNTDSEGFPEGYVFQMTSAQYRLSYEFLNAIAELGQDVTVLDYSGFRYTFHGADIAKVPQERWNDAFPVMALYKDSASYQGVMLAQAYQNGYTSYENNKDYIIVDFQAHAEDLPVAVTASFDLVSKSNDMSIAKHFSDLMREGKLYIYAYSKVTQSVYKPLDIFTLTESGSFSFELQEPITVVFSAIPLMDSGLGGSGNGSTGTGDDDKTDAGNGNGTGSETDNGTGNGTDGQGTDSPSTGVAFPAAAVLCGIAGCALLCVSRRSAKKER